MSGFPDSKNHSITFRHPTLEDASDICRIVVDSQVLDVNSCYMYLLLCRDFSNTCLVAEKNSQIIGFVTGYRPPERHDTLFIWQIAIDQSMRNRGLAKNLLTELVKSQIKSGVAYVEATVASTNIASRTLFESFAIRFNAILVQTDCFLESHFPSTGNHEAEPLIRIGPLTSDHC